MSEDLRTRINALSGRTTAAKLRAIMEDIDRKVREGVSHEDIVQTLRESGLEISLATFRGNLYRYRRSLASESAKSQDQKPGFEHEVTFQTIHVPPNVDFESALDPRQRAVTIRKYTEKPPQILGKRRAKP